MKSSHERHARNSDRAADCETAWREQKRKEADEIILYVIRWMKAQEQAIEEAIASGKLVRLSDRLTPPSESE